MKKNKALIPVLALSTMFISSTLNLHIVQAQKKEGEVSKSDTHSQGLLGYYFNDQNFKTPSLIANSEAGNLSISTSELDSIVKSENQKFQSAIWKGRIKVDEEGEYAFSTSDDSHAKIFINNQEISHSQKMRLEQGKIYEIKIKYQLEQVSEKGMPLKLYWITPNNQKEIIPDGNLLFPENKKKPSYSRAKRGISPVAHMTLGDEILDSDNDGIPDSLEIEGYTVDVKNKKTIIVPWMDNIHTKKGLTKYTSSPEKWSTTSDPYSDFAKVTGRIDKLVKPEARNPLVAAYPIIDVNMEKIIVSKIKDVTTGTGGSKSNTISESTSTSKTDSTSVSVGAEISASLFDFGAKVSTNFTSDHSSTVSIENSSSNTAESNWSNTISIKESEAAYLGAGIRYVNNGTAPIYQAKPTATLSLTNGTPLSTITAKENLIANHISPGTYYPSKEQASILVNTKDDFGSTPITINYQQLQSLEKERKLNLDTNQVNGKVGIMQPNGSLEKNLDWDDYIGQIKEASARLLLQTGDQTIERRVAAIDFNNPLEATKPDVTLKDALKLAFGFKEDNGKLQYEGISVENFEFIFDEETAKNISNQLKEKNIKNIYKALDQIQLNAKMNIQIQPKKGWLKNPKTGKKYYINDKGRKVTGWNKIEDKTYYFDISGVMQKLELLKTLRYPDTPPFEAFQKLEFYSNGNKLHAIAYNNGLVISPNDSYWNVYADGKLITSFNAKNPVDKIAENINKLNISGSKFTITPAIIIPDDIIKNAYQFSEWIKVGSNYNDVYLNVDQRMKDIVTKYRLKTTGSYGKDYGVQDAYGIWDGKIKINFLEYNAGVGLHLNEDQLIQIYAVTKDGREILILNKK